jgi:hypothetical protein
VSSWRFCSSHRTDREHSQNLSLFLGRDSQPDATIAGVMELSTVCQLFVAFIAVAFWATCKLSWWFHMAGSKLLQNRYFHSLIGFLRCISGESPRKECVGL